MAYEIEAALIQAAGSFLPTAALAVAAFVGLGGWRRQVQGGHAIDRSEACLSAVHEVADLIRAARTSVITMSEAAAAPPELVHEASNRTRAEALARAWESWKTFAATYRRAGYYVPMPKTDAAQEIAAVLTKLNSLARLIATYEPHEHDSTTHGAEFRRQLVAYRSQFLGFKPDGGARDPDDELEVRLRNAISSTEESLLRLTGGRK